MTIAQVVDRCLTIHPTCAIRHNDFPRPSAAIYIGMNGRMIYRMYPNSTGWDWKPSAQDLVRTDWFIIDGLRSSDG